MRRSLLLVLFLTFPGPLGAQDTLFSALDQLRHQAGLSVPVWNPLLAQACETRASDLADSKTLSHHDDRGRGPGMQMRGQGFPIGEYGEVLGAGPDWQAVWAAWLESPSHREVLTTPGWEQWAFGSARLGTATVWVVRFHRR